MPPHSEFAPPPPPIAVNVVNPEPEKVEDAPAFPLTLEVCGAPPVPMVIEYVVPGETVRLFPIRTRPPPPPPAVALLPPAPPPPTKTMFYLSNSGRRDP